MLRKKNRRRTRLEIAADILRIAGKGSKKTHVVYGANLNFKILEEYLTSLEQKGLVTYDSENSNNLIKTTEKGKEYLRQLHQLMVLT